MPKVGKAEWIETNEMNEGQIILGLICYLK